MTKETKNTVAAETIVENLKEFAMELHQNAKEGMVESLIEQDEDNFVLANFAHNVSHGLIEILQGKSADEALEDILGKDEDEEDELSVGSITVNINTGDANGIENIKDPKLKAQITKVVRKLADKLGGE